MQLLHHRFTVDAQTRQQLPAAGRLDRERLPASARILDTRGAPRDIRLQRPDQRIEHRSIGEIAQAPGRSLADVGIGIELQQLQQRLNSRR